LHLWSQIVGKYRLANMPWVNHAWHATLYVTPPGLTTGLIPDESGAMTLSFDFCDHRFLTEKAGGLVESFPLEPMSVAEFLERTARAVERLGSTLAIHGSATADCGGWDRAALECSPGRVLVPRNVAEQERET
jgi:hypothetical protein